MFAQNDKSLLLYVFEMFAMKHISGIFVAVLCPVVLFRAEFWTGITMWLAYAFDRGVRVQVPNNENGYL